MTDYYFKDPRELLMEDDLATKNKKRSMEQMNAKEMEYKFRSKQDIYVYLDEHSKLTSILHLICL